MGRQFIAVRPNGLDKQPELKKLLGKLKRTTEGRRQEARWTPPALWHVTLQFLGEESADKMTERRTEKDQELKDLLSNWRPPSSALTLRLHGLGAFPSNEEGRVLWIGVQESQDFLDMQADLSRHLTAAGIALSERELKPHLTLARFRNLLNLNDLIQLGGRKHFGDYEISELVLFESVLQGNVTKYVPLLRVPLATAPASDSDSAPKE